MIDRLIAVLGIELDLTGKEIADILWLATQMQEPETVAIAEPEVIPSPTPIRPTPTQPPPRPAAPPPVEQPKAAEAGIYQPPQRQGAVSQSLTLRVPDARSLREPLLLARSLKPLLQKVAAGWKMTLDETATVQQIAESQVWLPVLKPALEPWLELALVVDESISMQIWQRTIAELQRLLANYGVFRDVRVWGLVVDEQGVQIRPGLGTRRQALHSPSELIDPSGRRLILVATDCVASSWRSGRVLPALKLWATHSPMAIVQMLPEWLWARTGLGLASAVQFRGLLPGVPNQQLEARDLSPWDEIDLATGIKVPVVTLEPEKFAPWAQMVAGKGGVWTAGVVFEPEPIEPMESRAVAASSAEQRVQQFRVTASPLARRLAGLLASAPVVSLPVVRIIQDRMLPDSRQVHVAEVFLGGLLKPLSEIDAETNPDAVPYEFMEGVRNQLLESVPSSDAVTVLNQVSQFVAERLGLSVSQFAAVLRNPKQAEAEGVTDQSRPFAMVTAQILRGLGGEYAQFAAELESPGGEEGRSESKSAQTNHPDYAYYVTGSLPIEAPSYVYRQADRDLYEGLKNGEFCYVLNARQMGKSSLRVRTEERLRAEGFVCATIDITYIGTSNITPEQWYSGIIDLLVSSFELYDTFDFYAWWEENHLISPVQKFSKFLKDVLLTQVEQSIVIFVDEIDSVLSLPFKIDDFFAVIRDCYNNRASQPEYRRLTFALIGVITPSDLIQDKQKTPFDIGKAIDLSGFTLHEAEPLLPGLATRAENPQAVLREILVWTAGQPFLTQKICRLVRESAFPIALGAEVEWVRNLVQQSVIDRWETQDEPEHLKTIRNRILYSSTQRTIQLLGLYQQILQTGEIDADGSSAQRELCLSGLVVQQSGKLRIANRIYAAVFNQTWIDSALRDSVPSETTNRRLLLHQGNTQIYALHTRSPWLLPFDALVIPVGTGGGFGSFGKAFRDFLERPAISLSQAINSSLSEQDNFIESTQPLVIRLAPEVERRLSAVELVHGRYVICATVETNQGTSSQGAAAATEAIVRIAKERGFKLIVLPLLGTGDNGLPIEGVAIAMLNTVEAALRTPVSNEIEEITFVSNSVETIALLERLALQLDEHELSRSGSNTSSTSLHFPEEAMSIDSPFYMERVSVERVCYETITRPGALIRINAPGRKGKTSLLTRILHYAESQNYKAISINFQLLDSETLINLDRFLKWFCCRIAEELNLPYRVVELWTRPLLDSRQKCSTYIQQHILAELNCPLVLAIDSFDALFQSPDIVEGFASLLRIWHEQGQISPGWEKLRVVISHRQEIHTALNVNQSLSTVGLLIELPDFTQVQVQELASRYGLQWSEQQVKQLMDMVGGHPFLVQLAFCAIKNGKATLNSILESPLARNGIYNDYLRGCLNYIQYSQELAATLISVVSANYPIEINQEHRFKLESMGIIHSQGNRATPANNLYRLYFRDRLGNS